MTRVICLYYEPNRDNKRMQTKIGELFAIRIQNPCWHAVGECVVTSELAAHCDLVSKVDFSPRPGMRLSGRFSPDKLHFHARFLKWDCRSLQSAEQHTFNFGCYEFVVPNARG
jgi:hypothetical protein